MPAQSLRRSQFITTFGPGAILEGPQGPRIIPVLNDSGLFYQRSPDAFEITDSRLSRALLDGAGILRLPSNAELGIVDYNFIYTTFPFPDWALCMKHKILYRKITSDNRACPKCLPLPNPGNAWIRVRQEAIRFVRACPIGHLDDVDWPRLIDHAKPLCNPDYLLWMGGGGALRHIEITCPICHARMNLGTAYSREWPCSGRFPEYQGKGRPRCDQPAKIMQRGAANLRMAELQTALTIPPRETALHRLLEMKSIRIVLLTQQINSKRVLTTALEALSQQGLLRRAVLTEIQNYPEPTILAAIADTVKGELPENVRTLRLQEFQALSHAATRGAPAQPSPTPGAPPQFEVLQNQVRILAGPQGHQLRITPVNRLRVVMVQTGYRRLDPLNPVVDRAFDDGQQLWYPGVELFGEGIFLDLNPDAQASTQTRHFPFSGAAANAWFDAWLTPDSFGRAMHPDEQYQLHPVFVWWHTLAHRLMNALAVDSGYSAAAVRERVFVDVDEQTGEAGGGVLLYTSQPGGDGTLGGLVALVPEFERVLQRAIDTLDTCSNDPLCGEERFAPGKYNGAACYACALVSETSCEHRNMQLDRTLLLENLP
ncbi:MAG TPA: DUF1998 domain-containing protein [Ktedonobacterales bacterium]|jgi:hypothetical protein